MAALEAALSLLTHHPSSSSSKSYPKPKPSPSPSPSPNLLFNSSAISTSLNLRNTQSSPLLLLPTRKPRFLPFNSAVEQAEAVAETQNETENNEEIEDGEGVNQKRKLYVFNLPWSLSVVDIKNLFNECGAVRDVEIIKQKGGRSRGFAFVTMSSGDEALAVIDKYDSKELSGRVIKIEFAKRYKKPAPPRPVDPPTAETRHKLYVSNLAWKARSSHLRELFSVDYKPVSVRVVFDTPSGKSAGYGFVSFATKEEADDALLSMNGKEVLGRPIKLTLSEKNTDAAVSEKEKEEEIPEKPSEEQ